MSNNSKLVIKELFNNKPELVELTDKQTGDINGGYYYPLPIYYPTLQDFAIANQAAYENFLNNVIRA